MTELVPSVVVLDKGLDLVAAKVAAPIGSVLDCNNYEITDAQGLRRVDGFEPFDAQVPAGTTTLYYIRVDGTGTMPVVGDIIVIESTNAVAAPATLSRLLQEDGSYLLTEDSDYLIQE